MSWAYIIDGKEKISLSEGGCHFLESEITSVETRTTEQEIAGRDGVLIGSNTFDSFELVLKFYYEGIDNKDVLLFAEKIKKIIHARNAMYIVHSQMPGRKYAFNSAKIDNFETITSSDVSFAITFNCFKGYSESLKDTDEFSLSSGDWQLEQNILARDDIKYEHDIRYFQIYNGSSDTINPLMHHKLKIDIEINAPKGFSIVNLTNGNEFQYFKPLKNNNKLTILGVHPYLNNKRVGKNTNYDFLTLEPGFNEILIKGKGISNSPKTKFTFPFIYR